MYVKKCNLGSETARKSVERLDDAEARYVRFRIISSHWRLRFIRVAEAKRNDGPKRTPYEHDNCHSCFVSYVYVIIKVGNSDEYGAKNACFSDYFGN